MKLLAVYLFVALINHCPARAGECLPNIWYELYNDGGCSQKATDLNKVDMIDQYLVQPAILNSRQACHVSPLADKTEEEKIFWSALLNYLSGLTKSRVNIKAFPVQDISERDRNEVLFRNIGP